jgi:hypothetical protein
VDDIRDIVIIAALIGFSLLLAVFTLALAFAGYKTVRVVRRVRRLGDEGAANAIGLAHEKLSEWNARDSGPDGGLFGAGVAGLRWVRRRRRRRKKKRRFAVLDLLRR